MKLQRIEVQTLIDQVVRDMPRDECRTCDCFFGFLTRLALDSQEHISDITNRLKPLKEQIHGCMGCDPCPPADAYSKYIRRNLDAKPNDQPSGTSPCSRN